MPATAINGYYLSGYSDELISVRSSTPNRLSVVAVPEMGDNGDYSPCAYIRLLQPLDYLRELGLINLRILSAEEALRSRADILYCHRTSSADEKSASALIRYARENGIKLFYDLDDNLLRIDEKHPESKQLLGIVKIVETFLAHADVVFFSTIELRRQLLGLTKQSLVMGNALDQRLIADRDSLFLEKNATAPDKVGIMYMGTYTHSHDFELVTKVLKEIVEDFGDRVHVGILGVTPSAILPRKVKRVYPPASVGSSYPAFMSWMTAQREWQIGISPLQETPFNAGKSKIKALDYIAMGAVPVVSDVEAYRSIPSAAAVKVSNSFESWYEAIASLVSSPGERSAVAKKGSEYFLKHGTLEATVEERIETLARALT